MRNTTRSLLLKFNRQGIQFESILIINFCINKNIKMGKYISGIIGEVFFVFELLS